MERKCEIFLTLQKKNPYYISFQRHIDEHYSPALLSNINAADSTDLSPYVFGVSVGTTALFLQAFFMEAPLHLKCQL